jgi:hypothetical protein
MREIVREWVKKGSDFIAAKTLAKQKGLENQTGGAPPSNSKRWRQNEPF